LDEVVKLASNENPLPVSHRVRMAIEQAITEVGRYPDGNGFELKQSGKYRLANIHRTVTG
jgi:histidinol-phosphate aminotransferase